MGFLNYLQAMTETERIAEWVRSYRASPPSYKAESLRAVWINERPIFNSVVSALKLDLAKLMQEMCD